VNGDGVFYTEELIVKSDTIISGIDSPWGLTLLPNDYKGYLHISLWEMEVYSFIVAISEIGGRLCPL